MTIVEVTGTFTTTGSSTSIFGGIINEGLSGYSGWLFLDAIPVDTEVEIIIFTFDAQDVVLREYQLRYRDGKQVDSETSFFFPPITTQQYDVRIRTTRGTNFEVSWARYRQLL